MVYHPEAVHVVEACIRKGQPFLRVRKLESTLDAEQGEPFGRELDGHWRQINADVAGSLPGEFESVRGDATADLEHILAPEAAEVCDQRHMPFAALESLDGDFLEVPTAVLL